ncbi:unnamed protein product, partial [marine sediment metagenome]
PLDDYLSDNFTTMRKLRIKTKKDINSHTFYLEFKFRPFVETINKRETKSDKPCFKYENGNWTEEK